ncbi:hypothetical protein [Thiomonas sp.]
MTDFQCHEHPHPNCRREKNKAALGGLLNRIEISPESDLPGLCCQIKPHAGLKLASPRDSHTNPVSKDPYAWETQFEILPKRQPGAKAKITTASSK